MDPTVARVFYASVMLCALLTTWFSGDTGLRKVGLWMFTSWIGCNLIFDVCKEIGAEQSYTAIIASLNAVITVGLASTARLHKCQAATQVCTLYCLEFALIIVAFLFHQQGGAVIRTALNAVFLARIFVIGRASIVELVDRVRSRRERPRHWTLGGAGH
jgi:hypothetical protein